jgi:protein phosphatase
MGEVKMSKLIMMVGVPGSGKSTWVQNNKSETDVLVSRDAIRFAMLKEDEDYFAHESEVFNEFIWRIADALAEDKTVIADATHLNKKSRALVLDKVRKLADEIEAVVIDVDLVTALERNDNRTGRAFVPRGVIRRMYFQMEAPTKEEGFTKIRIIKEENNE